MRAVAAGRERAKVHWLLVIQCGHDLPMHFPTQGVHNAQGCLVVCTSPSDVDQSTARRRHNAHFRDRDLLAHPRLQFHGCYGGIGEHRFVVVEVDVGAVGELPAQTQARFRGDPVVYAAMALRLIGCAVGQHDVREGPHQHIAAHPQGVRVRGADHLESAKVPIGIHAILHHDVHRWGRAGVLEADLVLQRELIGYIVRCNARCAHMFVVRIYRGRGEPVHVVAVIA